MPKINKLYLTKLILTLLLYGIHSQGLCDSKLSLKTIDGKPLNLLDLKTEVYINGTYAEIEHTQIYENHFEETVETEYYFPRNEKSIFHKFSAKFDNYTIEGKIFEKEEAKLLYEENKKKGNTVAYSEINEKVSDVMKILVGNIPSKAKVEIKFSIIEPVEIILNKFYSFTLQSTLTPRYASKHSTDSNLNPDINCVSSKESNVKNWHIKFVLISYDQPLELIKNPSHKMLPSLEKVNTNSTTDNKTFYKYTFESDFELNKDFLINWSYIAMNEPIIILAEHPKIKNDYVLLTSFLPDLNDLSINQAEEKFLSGEHLDYLSDLDKTAPVEFVFVIDRSGSMSGLRIENLKRALQSFINILPNESYFNVVSFGSNYEIYSPEGSLKVNKHDSKQKFVKWVDEIDADMGGTEIFDAVKAAVHLKKIENHSRIIVLLTDGDVYDSQTVIDLVKRKTDSDLTKFCGVGIGNGISQTFIKEFGRKGKCTSVFVKDGEDIGDKTIHIIKSSLSQHLKDIKFETECFNLNGDKIFSEIKTKNFVLKNEKVENWFYIPSNKNAMAQNTNSSIEKCSVKVNYKSSVDNKEYTKTLRIKSDDINNYNYTEVWHKIAYFEKINDIETENEYKRIDPTRREEIVELSLKYKILSKFTSFFTVIKEAVPDENFDDDKINNPRLIKIPNVASVDYESNIMTSSLHSNSLGHAPTAGVKMHMKREMILMPDLIKNENENESAQSPIDLETILLIDVTPLDINIQVGNKLVKMVNKGSVIPTLKMATFKLEELCKMDSSVCKIYFWVGARKIIIENFKLEEIELDIDSLKRLNIYSLVISVDIDPNSIVFIRIKDESNNLILNKRADSYLQIDNNEITRLNEYDQAGNDDSYKDEL